MSLRTAARLAWSVCGLTLTIIVSAAVLFVLNGFGAGELPYFLVAEATAALVGGLISSRRPRNPVGWFVAGHAFCFSFGEFSRQYAIYGLQTDPGSLPLALAMASPAYWIWFPGIILMFSFLPLYFPDGRLVSPRWRPVVWLAILAGLVQTTVALVRPTDSETPGIVNPLGVGDLARFARVYEVVGGAPWLAVGVLSAASLVVRFRRARAEERQQIKWVVYVLVLLVSYTLIDQYLLEDRIPLVADIILFLVAFEGLWIAIAVAILRYRLYDIDVVINRTLVYGTMSVVLALVYLGGVVSLQRVFVVLTGQGSELAIVASTLAIAALFNPLRRRVQAFVDRRFYRRKYDARRTLDAFGVRLREETDLRALDDELVSVVQKTLQPAHVSLWLRPAGGRREGTGEPRGRARLQRGSSFTKSGPG